MILYNSEKNYEMRQRTNTALKYFITTIILMTSGWLLGKDSYPKAHVDFKDFKSLVIQAEHHREKRLIGLEEFLEKAKDENVIVLDTRSKLRFDRIHVEGAKHLNFADFTQGNLSEIIPSLNTTILIYCNNNFEGNQVDFETKVFTPSALSQSTLTEQFASQEKPLMLALNIPTYINLYGYGYRNIYELNELVDVNDSRITFQGSLIID